MNENGKRNLVGVLEFQRISCIPEAEVLAMLAAGELEFEKGPGNELYINLDGVSPARLANRSSGDLGMVDEERTALLEEMVASEVVSALEEIIDDAVELAVDWYMQKNNAAPPPPLADPADDD